MAVQVLGAIGFDHINILQALSKLSGLKHDVVAKRVGCTRQAVTHVLNLKRNNRSLQEKISKVYRVPVDVMFPVL